MTDATPHMTPDEVAALLEDPAARFSRRPAVSVPEEMLALQLQALHLEPFEREYVFHPARKWRFDFAWPLQMLAVEIEGGIHTRGRHVRPGGFSEDATKYNEATRLGWRLLRFTGAMVRDGRAVRLIEEVLNA